MADHSDDESSQGTITREEYLQHRARLMDGKSEQQSAFDKHVLTLASASLGASLLILKDIFPDPNFGSMRLLYCSWVLLLGSIVSTLISFQVSAKAHDRERKEWDKQYMDQRFSVNTATQSCLNFMTNLLNIVSMIAFVIGIILLLLFANSNT